LSDCHLHPHLRLEQKISWSGSEKISLNHAVFVKYSLIVRIIPIFTACRVGEIILGKKNPGINYLLHIESNESRKNMVPEKNQNSKIIYISNKTHDSTKTLRNDSNRLLQHCCSYLQPIWSLTCLYRIQESNIGLWDTI
jgi:hypothetical protein